MDELNYYEKLPDVMLQVDIEQELESILCRVEQSVNEEQLEVIYELSLRQVNNYALLNKELCSKITSIVCASWDKTSLDNVLDEDVKIELN